MVQKSTFGRVFVAVSLVSLMVGSGFLVFKSLGYSLFAGPASSPASSFCVEQAIYLQDRLNNEITRQNGSVGVFANPESAFSEPLLDAFTKDLAAAKTRCVGRSPDLASSTHRLFLSLEEQERAYKTWVNTTRALKGTFARDQSAALEAFTVQ